MQGCMARSADRVNHTGNTQFTKNIFLNEKFFELSLVLN